MQSRYYNPEWGRFVNADGSIGELGDMLGHNVFAYCKNNPVNMVDADGRCAILAIIFAPEIAGMVTTFITAAILAAPGIINTACTVTSIYGSQIVGISQNLYDKISDNSGNSNSNSNSNSNINSNSSSSNNSSSPNNKKPDKYKKYDPRHIEKKYGLEEGEFHAVKESILATLKKQHPEELKRLGDNPDIYLSRNGLIQFVSRIRNYKVPTDWDIKSFLP